MLKGLIIPRYLFHETTATYSGEDTDVVPTYVCKDCKRVRYLPYLSTNQLERTVPMVRGYGWFRNKLIQIRI